MSPGRPAAKPRPAGEMLMPGCDASPLPLGPPLTRLSGRRAAASDHSGRLLGSGIRSVIPQHWHGARAARRARRRRSRVGPARPLPGWAGPSCGVPCPANTWPPPIRFLGLSSCQWVLGLRRGSRPDPAGASVSGPGPQAQVQVTDRNGCSASRRGQMVTLSPSRLT
jgi:hypothetical protein